MKICFFLPQNPKGGFNPKLGGGSELALYYLTTQLAKMGLEVHVILDGPSVSHSVIDDVHVHMYPIPYSPLGAYTSTKTNVGRICTQYKFDVLVGFELTVTWSKATAIDGLIDVANAKRMNLVYYVGNHYPWLISKNEQNPWMLWRSLRRFVHNAKTLMAASSIMGRAVAANAKVDRERVKIVPFGVPLEEYASNVEGNRSDVLFVGRIIPHKGLMELVEAARILRDMGENLNFVVVGPRGILWDDSPGDHYLKLMNLVEQYGLKQNVVFTGSLPREQVVALMQRSKVFAFPSHAEGFGVALIQAMAAGAVPVVYKIEPLTEIVGEAGVYAEQGDPESLAKAIIKANTDQALPQMVRARIQRYSIRSVAKEFLEALTDPVEGQPSNS
ncbi:MAG: glycosyltransferase family 4 protein [Thermoprotei archaeon]